VHVPRAVRDLFDRLVITLVGHVLLPLALTEMSADNLNDRFAAGRIVFG
jgi:hypothetical protein